MPVFEAPILFCGQDNFLIDESGVSTPSQAAARALERFKSGAEPDELGNEWREPERVGTIKNLDTGEETTSPDTALSKIGTGTLFWQLFHQEWGKASNQPGYDKRAWLRMQLAVEGLELRCLEVSPTQEVSTHE